MIGSTLSHYKITAELGRGGMGIVYRATDTKLNREVALKILPAAALASEEDRARFFREAQAAAQLHHPNIATVFEIDEAILKDADGNDVNATDGPRPYIAMEFISGETLQETIKKAPLKLADAVNITSQVAEALKAAHAKEIVHRDIKSANVMITEDGIAKVLDFGLAKTNNSTMLTRMGSTLGTVAYMSPEQARGQEVDGRSDLYSLGTMMYEMICGQLPFAGEYEQAVVYGILNETPDPFTSKRTGVPMQLEWIVNKLLAKEADYRYQSAAGLLADLMTVDLSGSGASRRSMPAMSAAQEPLTSETTANKMPVWGWGIVVVAIILGVLSTWLVGGSEPDPSKSIIRATLDVMNEGGVPYTVAVSKSGSLLSFSDREGVTIKNLETGEEWDIPDSELVTDVRFSSDARWMILQKPGLLLRSPVRGGRPFKLVDVIARYSSVNIVNDAELVYESANTIRKLDMAGGEPVELLARSEAIGYDDPFVTEDERFLIAAEFVEGGQTGTIKVFDFQSGRLLGDLGIQGRRPIYLDTGHLLYQSGSDGMYAVPVSLENIEIVGASIPIGRSLSNRAFSVTSDGHLFSADQLFSGVAAAERQLEKLDWQGNKMLLSPERGNYDDFALNKDGRRVVIEVFDSTGDLWVVDIVSGVRNQITFEDSGDDARWHPKGDSILYAERRGVLFGEIATRAADGSGQKRVLYRVDDARIDDPDPSPDFKHVVFEYRSDVSAGSDIWMLDVSSGDARPIIAGEGDQERPRFSVDGKYIVYSAPESDGTPAIWIQPISLDGSKWNLSRGFGFDARWSPDGTSVYFRTQTGLEKVVVFTEDGVVSPSNSETVISGSSRLFDWDFLPDGTGIVHVVANGSAEGVDVASVSGNIDVVYNWTEWLKKEAPASK